MRIRYKQLKDLPVVTRSGDEVGKVHDLVIDVDTHQIIQYVIKSAMIGGDKRLVHFSQVLSITAEQMVVEDGVLRDAVDTVKRPATGADPVTMREEI